MIAWTRSTSVLRSSYRITESWRRMRSSISASQTVAGLDCPIFQDVHRAVGEQDVHAGLGSVSVPANDTTAVS